MRAISKFLTIGAVTIVAFAAMPSLAGAQAQLLTPPRNVVLPNVNGVPSGPYGGLEDGAYAARVDDASAAWFNPAGLSRATTAQITGNAGLYQFTTLVPNALPNTGGGLQQLPNLVAFSVHTRGSCTVGLAIVTTNSWIQETDAEIIAGSAASGQRFAYSADAEHSRRNINLSGGCAQGRLRYGGGLSFALTNLRLVDSISDRLSSGTGLTTALLTTRRSGSALQLRPIIGVQFDQSEKWQFGVVMRTPGATLYRSGVFALDGTYQNGAISQGASVFDSSATFTNKLPWEFQGGGAYVSPRVQVEVDLQAFTGGSSYAMLSTANPAILYSDSGQGMPPSITTQSYPGLFTSPRGIVNVAIGGHYQLIPNRSFLLHAGFTTDMSPVNADDQVFDQVDLYGWTIGLSGQAKKLQFAGGVNIRRGTTNNAVLRDLLTGAPVATSLSVHTTAFIYSLAYQF